MKAEWRGGLPLLGGSALLCGFYLNELLLKLVAARGSASALFADYAEALAALAAESAAAAQATVLRRFEVRLLAAMGYALNLASEVDSGAPIDPSRMYHYVPDRGPRLQSARVAREPGIARSRRARRDAASRSPRARFPIPKRRPRRKRLMREVLDHHLEERHIVSRRVVRDLMALDEEGQD